MFRTVLVLLLSAAVISAAGYDTAAPSGPAPAYGEASPGSANVGGAGSSGRVGGGAAPYETDRSAIGSSKTIQFPLKSCYLNDDGFMCCNKELEKLMSDTYAQLAQSRNGKWKKCNIHQVTVAVQRAAEQRFDVQFEAVTGAGDYASKNNFSGDLVCKIKRDSSYILAYATPQF